MCALGCRQLRASASNWPRTLLSERCTEGTPCALSFSGGWAATAADGLGCCCESAAIPSGGRGSAADLGGSVSLAGSSGKGAGSGNPVSEGGEGGAAGGDAPAGSGASESLLESLLEEALLEEALLEEALLEEALLEEAPATSAGTACGLHSEA